MKRFHKFFVFALTFLLLTATMAITAMADGPRPSRLSRIGSYSRTVLTGREFELKVKITAPKKADDDHLRWKILSGSSVIRFDDDDRNDDEAEFKAIKAGTAKVRCYVNKNTKVFVDFVVKVQKPARPTKLTRKGAYSRSISTGKTFELEVKMNSSKADDNQLRWKILSGSSVIRISDRDRYDDDVTFKAVKSGTAKVRCYVNGKSSVKTDFVIKVTAPSSSAKISRIGSQTVTVEAGDDRELKVKISGGRLSDKYLKWTIKDTRILGYDDDRYGDELEVKGKKPGTTTVTCQNLKTKSTVTYTVKVILDRDDDWDDDRDDDWDDDSDDDWDDD